MTNETVERIAAMMIEPLIEGLVQEGGLGNEYAASTLAHAAAPRVARALVESGAVSPVEAVTTFLQEAAAAADPTSRAYAYQIAMIRDLLDWQAARHQAEGAGT
jgi:hypothetical protein